MTDGLFLANFIASIDSQTGLTQALKSLGRSQGPSFTERLAAVRTSVPLSDEAVSYLTSPSYNADIASFVARNTGSMDTLIALAAKERRVCFFVNAYDNRHITLNGLADLRERISNVGLSVQPKGGFNDPIARIVREAEKETFLQEVQASRLPYRWKRDFLVTFLKRADLDEQEVRATFDVLVSGLCVRPADVASCGFAVVKRADFLSFSDDFRAICFDAVSQETSPWRITEIAKSPLVLAPEAANLRRHLETFTPAELASNPGISLVLAKRLLKKKTPAVTSALARNNSVPSRIFKDVRVGHSGPALARYLEDNLKDDKNAWLTASMLVSSMPESSCEELVVAAKNL